MPKHQTFPSTPYATGLGLRRDFIEQITEKTPENVDFWEIAPENWMRIGGRLGQQLRQISEKNTLICHGLSLSIGSSYPLDTEFLQQLRKFMTFHEITSYSEHLSYSSDEGHLYDLLPIPFTEEAIRHVAGRIKQVQDILEQRIAIENISYYAAPGQELSELDFLLSVLEEADCDLLLDINNIYVNSINHGYDSLEFLSQLPGNKIRYAHIAGHFVQSPNFLVDTHGAAVTDPVWDLLEQAYRQYGIFPTLLERDFNIPELEHLVSEVKIIAKKQLSARMNENFHINNDIRYA